MPITFTSTKFAEPDNTDGSLGHGVGKAYIALVSDFADGGLKGVYANPSNEEEEVTVEGDHEFQAGKGFVEVYHDPQSTETDFMAAMNGEGKGANVVNEGKIFYPGTKKNVSALLKLRPQLISLFGDINCAAGKYIQLGSKCTPAYISAWEWGMKNIHGTDMKGYNITIKAYSNGLQHYDGAVVKAS
jgi:hypothetical protein